MNAVTTTERAQAPSIRQTLGDMAAEFKAVLPSHITVEAFQRVAMTAIQGEPALLRANRKSLLASLMKCAQDKLLPDGREAALVVYKTSKKDANGQWHKVELVQYVPMVYGLRKKILQSGEVTDIFTAVVYRQEIEAGVFYYEEGTDRQLRHKPLLDPDFQPTDDDIALAYSIATLKDGSKVFDVLRRFEINKIRESSAAGALFDKFGKPRKPSGPWVDWFAEMAQKSVLKHHAKKLPMSGDVLLEIQRDEDMSGAMARVAEAFDVEPDAPTAIEGPAEEADEAHDPETGEIVEAEAKGASDAEEGEAAPETDENGLTVDPAEKKAEEIIAAARKAETVIDLDAIEKREAEHIDALPSEIASVVSKEFTKQRARLKPAKAAKETA